MERELLRLVSYYYDNSDQVIELTANFKVMEKNIIALLNKNLRVIIPDFGAFIIRQKQPKVIVFNEFLRYDDGLLIDYIVNNEEIDREIAIQQVSDFAEDSTKLLESGKDLIIEGLGRLHREKSGRINFIESPVDSGIQEISHDEATEEDMQVENIPESSGAINLAGTTDTFAPKTKTAKKTTKSRGTRSAASGPKVDKVIKEKPGIKVKKAPVPKPKAKSKSKSKSISKPKPIPIPIPIPEPVTEIKPEPQPVPAPETPRIPEPVRLQSPDSVAVSDPAPADEVPSTNRINKVLLWVLLFLFVNAVILAWFLFNNRIRGIFKKNSIPPELVTDSLYERLADSVKAAAMDTTMIYAGMPADSLAPVLTSARFYIVAGCFRDEINAEELVNSLIGLGYNATQFGKIGNLYAVCFASFDNKDEAVLELKRIREKAPDAWMTRF